MSSSAMPSFSGSFVAPPVVRPSWQAISRMLFAAVPLEDRRHSRVCSESTSSSSPEHIEAFEHFFRQYESRISGYLWHMTDEQTAYDLSQETFLRAWQHFAEIRTYPVPASWLFRVATNLALGHLRRRVNPVGAATPIPEGLGDNGADLTTRVAEHDHIMQTLNTLPPKQRAILVLREIYGLSTQEAAETLGISPVAAKRLLTRAYHRFRQCYLGEEERR
jgi:RNA polymerase sigma-70 factor, ECF subfamily